MQEEEEEEEVQLQEILPPLFWVHVVDEDGLKPESGVFTDRKKGVFVW